MENKMTTEQFLADLVANTVKLNKARLDYAQKLSELRDNYDEELDSIQARERQALDELHDAREEFESSEEKYKIDCQGLRRERNEVGREYNEEKAKAKTTGYQEPGYPERAPSDIREIPRFGWYTLGNRRRTPAPRLDE